MWTLFSEWEISNKPGIKGQCSVCHWQHSFTLQCVSSLGCYPRNARTTLNTEGGRGGDANPKRSWKRIVFCAQGIFK